MRFGRKGFIPVLRLGFSIQGTGHDSQFFADGVELPNPDLGINFETGIMAGAGLSFRAGKNFMAEASVSSVSKGTNELRALEAGIYAGYGW